MARWDVVPWQVFTGVFSVGVVAFHSYGIDRVELSFNGGPWVKIASPSLNPSTKVNEYWAKIDAAAVPDGRVELRAVAYPKQGMPCVLDTLVLYANSKGTLKTPKAEISVGTSGSNTQAIKNLLAQGGHPILELPAGHHVMPSGLTLPTDGWLTVRPKPGVKKSECFVWAVGKPSRGNIAVRGLTMMANGGGRNEGTAGSRLWFDDVDFNSTATTDPAKVSWWTAGIEWSAKYFTDFTARNFNNPFYTCHDGIIRNCVVENVFQDAIKQGGLIANVEVKNLGPIDPNAHADVFQWFGYEPQNMIVYNVKALDVRGQGLYPGDISDSAIVDVNINLNPSWGSFALQMVGKTRNVLIQDGSYVSSEGTTVRSDQGFVGQDVVLRNVVQQGKSTIKTGNGITVLS